MLKAVAAIAIATLLSLLAIHRTDSFSPERIRAPLLADCDALGEPFTWPHTFRYLARGRQMYAFESEDGKYVLKFFDAKKLKIPWYAKFPLPALQQIKIRAETKIRIYPESYRLAYQWLKLETGLIAVHMGRPEGKYPFVQLIDRASRNYIVNLNEIPFVLQKKGTGGLGPDFIDQFLAIHEKRIRCNIADLDRGIRHNYAWSGEQLLYIDPARFFYDPDLLSPEKLQNEWRHLARPLRRLLQQCAPEELEAFDAKLALCIKRCVNH